MAHGFQTTDEGHRGLARVVVSYVFFHPLMLLSSPLVQAFFKAVCCVGALERPHYEVIFFQAL